MSIEKKRLKEQTAFHGYYTNTHAASSPEPGAAGRRRSHELSGARLREPAVHRRSGTLRLRRRVVTSPEPVRQPAPWHVLAERRAQLRQAHSHPGPRPVMVRRSYAQTDVSSSSGRMRAIRYDQLKQNAPQIPVRSGRQARRRGFIARVLAFLVVLVIGVLGAHFALTSPALRVQQVSVEGTQNPALIGTISHMGIQGQNIFLVDTAALTTRIEMLPQVAAANVGKQWPNQLIVTVAERVPVLLWQTQHGTYSVDGQGVVIAPAGETVGADHLVTVIDMRSRQVGEAGQAIGPGAHLNPADVAFALQMFARLPQIAGINAFTLRYDAASPAMPVPVGTQSVAPLGSFTVQSAAGWIAYLGSADDTNPLDNRLLELQQILALAQRQQLNLATIDLRFGLRPVYTLKKM